MRENRRMTTERATLTAELIDAGRHLVERGLVQASGGNLSVRLPGTDRFLVTGTGTWLDRLTPDDFAELTLDGEHAGGAPRPSVEWKLHQRTYAVRPDAACIVHLHPQHVLLVDMLGAPLRFTTLDHQYYLGSAGRVPFHPSGSQEIADAAAEAAPRPRRGRARPPRLLDARRHGVDGVAPRPQPRGGGHDDLPAAARR